MSFWTSKLVRRGRKEHRCELCQRAILKGEPSYQEAGTTDDADFNSYRSCVPCHDLVSRLYTAGHVQAGEGFMIYELPEIARDADEPWPPARAAISPDMEGDRYGD